MSLGPTPRTSVYLNHLSKGPPSIVTFGATGARLSTYGFGGNDLVYNRVYVLTETPGTVRGGEERVGLLKVETFQGPAGRRQDSSDLAGNAQSPDVFELPRQQRGQEAERGLVSKKVEAWRGNP